MPPRQNRKERVKKYLPHHFREEPLLKRFLTPFQAFPCIGDILKIKRNKTKPKFSFRIYKAKISSFHQPKRKKELMPNLPKPFCLRWACKQVGWTDAALSATCWSWFPASPSVQHGEACACGGIAGTRPISFAHRPKNYQFDETRAMARSSWSIPTAKGKKRRLFEIRWSVNYKLETIKKRTNATYVAGQTLVFFHEELILLVNLEHFADAISCGFRLLNNKRIKWHRYSFNETVRGKVSVSHTFLERIK